MGRYSRGGPYGSIFRLVDNRTIVSPHSCPGRPVQDVMVCHVHLLCVHGVHESSAIFVSMTHRESRPVFDVSRIGSSESRTPIV